MFRSKQYPNPWKGLNSYQEGDDIHGRDEEISKIFEGISDNVQTVIYGRSGIGKTSLIQAGLYPLLRKDGFFPVPVRFGILPDDIHYEEAVVHHIEGEAYELGYEVRQIPTVDGRNDSLLWSYLYRTQFTDQNGQVQIPVLFFDQFEEVLNNAATYSKTLEFLLAIYPLLENSRSVPTSYLQYSNYRFVFSLREDYLYYLEDIIDRYNLAELRYNRFRLTAFDSERARRVISIIMEDRIKKVSDDYAIQRKYNRSLYDKMIKAARNSDAMESIDTAILSIIGTQLCTNYEYVADNKRLNLRKLIYKYYSDCMRSVSVTSRRFLESKLVTSDGRRTSMDYNEIIRKASVSIDELNDLIYNKRIIRVLNQNSKDTRIEFCHDIITKLINDVQFSAIGYSFEFILDMFNFMGTASRREFRCGFMFTLSVLLVSYALIFQSVQPLPHFAILCFSLLSLFTVMSMISLTVRRYHGLGMSGWHLFMPKLKRLFMDEDSDIPYKNKISSIRPFSVYYGERGRFFHMRSINRLRYAAIHVYLLYLLLIINSIIGIITFSYSYGAEIGKSFYSSAEQIFAADKVGYISRIIQTANMYITSMESFPFVIFITLFITIIEVSNAMVHRLPALGRSRWWVIVPVANIFFWIYGFLPDIHFEVKKKQRMKQN